MAQNTPNPQTPATLDLLDEADVLVAGGGLAGVCAALSCAEAGLRVALAEERGALGWEIPHGLDLFLAEKEAVPPTLQRVLDELTKRNAFRAGTLDPVATECLLDDLTQAAGVRVHFRAFAGTYDAERGVARLTTKSGPLGIRAPFLIDATENSRLAVSAGARFEAASDARVARACLLTGVEPPAAPARVEVEGVSEVTARATLWPNEAHLSIVTDAKDAARAESQARFALAKAIEAARATLPGFEKANLSLSAHESFALRCPKLVPSSLPGNVAVAGPAVKGERLSLQARAGLGEAAAKKAAAARAAGATA
ncbi:MAG: FAD-dependent oxidoreductase [Planctomycetes bacterium]|nr:FAD-dependent oxidoreductase [Planctomycetota bacterium]